MIIFDLDSTLRSVKKSDHMIPDDITISLNWVEWQKHVNETSEPIESVITVYNALYDNNDILVVTSSMFGTAEWFLKHDIGLPDGIVERDEKDNRTPEEYKIDWVKKNTSLIDLWVDDNETVCDFTRSMNIPTVQVKE